MSHRKVLLNDDRAMPPLGLGTWKAEPGVVGDAVREAIRIGYRHFDCSPIYGNEPEIGAALAAAIDAGDVTRDELWITSKLWNSEHGRKRVKPALEKTLDDLRLDYVDLYLIHWPVPHQPGVAFPDSGDAYQTYDECPLEDTWAGMADVREAGLARSIGVSNFSAEKMAGLIAAGGPKPAVDQVEAHPLLAQPKLKAWCDEHRVLITAYAPLGSAGRDASMKAEDEPVLLENPIVNDIALQHELTPGQVLIAWALTRGTAVIPKSSDPGRLRENFAAGDVTLPAEDMRRLEALDRHYRYFSGDFWCPPGSPHTPERLWDEAG